MDDGRVWVVHDVAARVANADAPVDVVRTKEEPGVERSRGPRERRPKELACTEDIRHRSRTVVVDVLHQVAGHDPAVPREQLERRPPEERQDERRGKTAPEGGRGVLLHEPPALRTP